RTCCWRSVTRRRCRRPSTSPAACWRPCRDSAQMAPSRASSSSRSPPCTPFHRLVTLARPRPPAGRPAGERQPKKGIAMSSLEYPEDLRYTAEHEWVRLPADGGAVRVGITAYAQDALGDVVYVTLPEIGATVTEGESCGEVESTKSVSD